MSRLNQKAWKILQAEVEKCAANEKFVPEVARDIALKRLEKLRDRAGKPIAEEELRQLTSDIFPNFSEQALKIAAQANRTFSPVAVVPWAVAGLAGLAGLVWLVNLPSTRQPVARTASILLFPTHVEIDRNYREAIAHLEQAEQLVDRAASKNDLQLGTQKVRQAQKNLDALPVEVLDNERQPSWQVTWDEIRALRARVGRMKTIIFQEKNAIARLETLEATIQQAKQAYHRSFILAQKQAAIQTWQTALDELFKLPPATLARRRANAKLDTYQSDFQQASSLVARNNRANTLIDTAKQFADQAAQTCQNSPLGATQWHECVSLWEVAIALLKTVDEREPGYLETQTLLATYQSNLGNIKLRQQTAVDSPEVRAKIEQLQASLAEDVNAIAQNQILGQLQEIPIFPKAPEMLNSEPNELEEF
ncbi:MAG: hypothetical protein IGR93_07320 [Hydrococcus sp. C42_A2020_068]|uniref:hypothetical protein n=1 Tax=Pleurocapsa sp. PCC 7327 TaxID=118163 RepID=UPI00029FE0AF|nr:hypothetical protein [Pleurocapsa sp. PCC 7327]AFY79292.1 hypothetical protein Ple7327_4161 [Pleurocapsa sp. PCC 7327]MBF2019901.1 hypothetical protein [Hydrococcus sp. C42_A2020_068]